MSDQLNAQEFVNFCRAQLKNLRMFEAAEKIGNSIISLEQSKVGLAAEVKELEAKIEAAKDEHEQLEAQKRDEEAQFKILVADKHAKLDADLKEKAEQNGAEIAALQKAIDKAKQDLKILYADIDAAEEQRTKIKKDLEEKQTEIDRLKAKFA